MLIKHQVQKKKNRKLQQLKSTLYDIVDKDSEVETGERKKIETQRQRE